jgi:CrcB protein
LPGRRVEGDFVIKIAVLVFIGGALGSVLREFLMLAVPTLADGFPLDILAANLVAACLLGFIAALHDRKGASDSVYALLGTGVTGGLSTFSSFAYASAVLIKASMASSVVALTYVLTSLVLGFIAAIVGMKIGEQRSDSTNS